MLPPNPDGDPFHEVTGPRRDLDAPRDAGAADADRRAVTEALAAAAQGADIAQIPLQLCRACTRVLSVSGASISLASDSEVRATWAASDETASRLAETQYTLGTGPCQTALVLAAPVFAADLTEGPDARRWPIFAQYAVQLGVRAVFSLPLGGAQPIGTLDLYRTSPGPLTGRDLETALLARDAATYALFALASSDDAGDEGGVASWLDAAEADHDEVHQAVGMVMVQLNVDPQQALDRLRARAFAQSRTVTEVARDVTARVLRLSDEDDGDGEESGGGGGRHGGFDQGR